MSVLINFASFNDLLTIPRVSNEVASEIMQYRFIHGNLSFDDILEGAVKSLRLNCSFLQAVNFAENPALEVNDDREDFGLLTIDETKGEPVSIQSYTSNVCTLSVCTTSSMTIPAVCTSTSTRVTHSCATPIFTTSTPMVQRRDCVEKYNEVGDISVEFHGFPQTPERSAEVMENTNIQRPIVGMQGGLRDGLGFLHTGDSAPLRLHGDQIVSDSTMFNPAVEVPNSRGRKSTGMEVNDDRRMDLDERKRNPMNDQVPEGGKIPSSLMNRRAQIHQKQEAKLLVSNLPANIDKCCLYLCFEKYGEITNMRIEHIIEDTAAEITFKYENDAKRARQEFRNRTIDGKAVHMFVVCETKPSEDTEARSNVSQSVNDLSEPLKAEILSPDPKVSKIEFTDPCSTPPLISEHEQSHMKMFSPDMNMPQSRLNQSYVHEKLFQPNMVPIQRSGSYNSKQMYMYKPNTVPIPHSGSYNNQPLYQYVNDVSPQQVQYIPVTNAQNFETSHQSLGTPHINHPRNPYRDIPCDLRFNGRSNWRTFIVKYNRLSAARGWNSEEKLYNLLWCLEGKACDLYMSLIDCQPDITYADLIAKFKNRYDITELIEISRLNFDQSHQYADEELNDWADRSLVLAQRAGRDLSEAIVKFCHGCNDMKAGQVASYLNPKTMEEAINKIKWHQHTIDATYGFNRERSIRFMFEEDSSKVTSNEVSTEENADDKILALEEMMQEMTAELSTIQQQSRWKSNRSKVRCYTCNKKGHYKNECPTRKKHRRKAKRDDEPDRQLNIERSEQQANQ